MAKKSNTRDIRYNVPRPRGKKDVGKKVSFWTTENITYPNSKQIRYRNVRTQRTGKITEFMGNGRFKVKTKDGTYQVKKEYLSKEE